MNGKLVFVNILKWLPVVVLVGSFGVLFAEYGPSKIWIAQIHENGARNIFRVLWYPDHFLREVLVCSYWLTFVFCCLFAFKSNLRHLYLDRVCFAYLFSAIALVVFCYAYVVFDKGWSLANANFFQKIRREDIEATGVHWHYHIFHLIFMILGFWWMALLFIHDNRPRRIRVQWVVSVFFIIGVFTIGLIVKAPILTVLEDVSIAHQLREIQTHALISLPLCFFSVVPKKIYLDQRKNKPTVTRVLVFLMSVVIVVSLAAELLRIDIASSAQQNATVSSLVFAHHLEHCLDYLYIYLGSKFIGRVIFGEGKGHVNG